MKKLYAVSLALVAVFALSALTASSAFAVTLLAEWLLNGGVIATPDLVEIPGELTLVNTNGGGLGVKVEILCSGILDGTVGPGSADLITELLNLAGEKIGEGLGTLELVCTNTLNCTNPKVWAEGLPWETEAELLEQGTEVFFSDYLLKGQYLAECTILGVAVEELCEAGITATELKNEGNNVINTFSDAFQELAGFKLGACGGRAETAEVKGPGTITPVGGGTLAVSSGA